MYSEHLGAAGCTAGTLCLALHLPRSGAFNPIFSPRWKRRASVCAAYKAPRGPRSHRSTPGLSEFLDTVKTQLHTLEARLADNTSLLARERGFSLFAITPSPGDPDRRGTPTPSQPLPDHSPDASLSHRQPKGCRAALRPRDATLPRAVPAVVTSPW